MTPHGCSQHDDKTTCKGTVPIAKVDILWIMIAQGSTKHYISTQQRHRDLDTLPRVVRAARRMTRNRNGLVIWWPNQKLN